MFMDALKPPTDREPKGPAFTAKLRGAKRNQGWSKEGIERFNQLFDSIVEDRTKRAQVDVDCQKKKRLEMANKNAKRKQKSIDMREQGWVAAREDVMSGEESDEEDIAAKNSSAISVMTDTEVSVNLSPSRENVQLSPHPAKKARKSGRSSKHGASSGQNQKEFY